VIVGKTVDVPGPLVGVQRRVKIVMMLQVVVVALAGPVVLPLLNRPVGSHWLLNSWV
jgi:hypothetical protein